MWTLSDGHATIAFLIEGNHAVRRVLFALMVTGPFVAGQPANWAEAVAGEPADRYTVPQGGTEELMQFIGELSEFRPGTPDEDLQHRGKFRRALQQAAEKLVKLEKDPKSEARQAATFILLNNRTRWIAQADPHAQKQTIVDVAAYLKDQGAKGPGEVAARLANSLGETLEGMGELDLAADAYKQFAAAVAQGKARELADVAARMEDESRRLADKSKSVAPAGSKPKIAPKGRLVPIDLHSKVNRKLIASSGSAFQENHLGELPRGEQTFAGVRFRIGDGVIETAGANQLDRPEKSKGSSWIGRRPGSTFCTARNGATSTARRSATTWSTTRMAPPPRFPSSTGRTCAIGGPQRTGFP